MKEGVVKTELIKPGATQSDARYQVPMPVVLVSLQNQQRQQPYLPSNVNTIVASATDKCTMSHARW